MENQLPKTMSAKKTSHSDPAGSAEQIEQFRQMVKSWEAEHKRPAIFWLDAFCGAGGASTGIERVPGNFVAIGINHDIRAIDAHKANHPNTVHLNDDIRKVKIQEVAEILHSMGIHRINLWWSAECTHLSNAKGGASRNADSRMLSEDIFRYIRGLERHAISVELVMVENVREFFSWTSLRPKLLPGKRGVKHLEKGYTKAQIDLMEAVIMEQDYEAEVIRDLIDLLAADLLASGHYATDKGELLLIPDSSATKEKGKKATDKGSKGAMYLKWVRHMEAMGYVYDHRMLNAADFGAYQSRNRYFGVFVKKSLGIRPQFPQPTHAKNPQKGEGLFANAEPLKRWKACREILQLDNKGESILYGRQGKPTICADTLARIKTGINKFPGEMVMVDRGNSGSTPAPGSSPAPTVRASFKNGLIQVNHIDNHSFNVPPVSIDEPMPTAMANRDKYLMQGFIVPSAYGNAPYLPNRPLLTLTANRKHQYLCTPFIANQYGSNGSPNQCSSVDSPTWAVTTSNHQGLCLPLIVNNYGNSTTPTTVDGSLGTVTTKPKAGLSSIFYAKYYGSGENVFPVSEPIGTLTTKDRFCLVDARFVQYHHEGKDTGNRVQPLEDPVKTIGTENHPSILQAQFVQYYYGGGAGNSDQRVKGLEDPLGVVGTHHTPGVINAQFVQYTYGGHNSAEHSTPIEAPLNTVGTGFTPQVIQAILTATSSEWPIHIGLNPPGNKWCPAWMRIEGAYLVDNRIVDVFYRMLLVSELKLAQGFPADYKLDPKSETVAKKHIGNAVHVDAAMHLVSANCGPASPYSKTIASLFGNKQAVA